MNASDRMVLHWSPRSPYVRKVVIAAHELGLQDRIERVRTVVGGTDPHHDLMRENPLGKIPTLVLADGTIIYDSPVVCEALDRMAGGSLFPADWQARLVALRWQALGSGMLDVSLLRLTERNKPEAMRSAPHEALWKGKIDCCLDALEAEAGVLGATPFNIGHIAIGVALGYLDFRFAAEAWREGRPGLAAWQAGFDARDSVAANRPQEG
jgi:glutathione S-transferase